MRRRLAWVGGLVSLLAGPTEPAHAQQPPAASDAPATSASLVELVVIGASRDDDALLDMVRDRLGRLGLTLDAHSVATLADASTIARGSAAARVQVDLRSAGEAVIVVEGKRQAPKQRTLHRDPSPVVAREELAEAIESAAVSQLFADPGPEAAGPSAPTASGAPTAAAPAPAAPAAPAPPDAHASGENRAPPYSAGSLRVDISTLAGGGWFASAVGPVVALGGEVTVASRSGWSLALSGRSVLPFDETMDSITCHASALAMRALAGIDLVRASWLSLAAGAGGGVDILWATPRSAVLPSSVFQDGGAATMREDPIVSAFLAAHMALVPSVALSVVLLGDLDLMPSRYVIIEGTAVEPVLAAWRFRPTLLAGFTFTALGQPAFTAWNAR